ncbi:MAG: ATP-binding cassette domain-containing protein [Mycoplasma sp.]|nr:ATP-binding cassette domain-containing protein [Mycoplasma sp.]
MEILKVENLKRVYGTGASKVVALDNVSFTVEKGEFVSIVGASGSGKSTLLHLIGGVDRPTSGKVFINDEDIYKLNNDDLAIFRRRQIGLIYQFYNLIPILNVIENISLPLELDGRKPDKKDLNEMLELLGLENNGEAPVIIVSDETFDKIYNNDLSHLNLTSIYMDAKNANDTQDEIDKLFTNDDSCLC